MKIIEREAIDVIRWDALVTSGTERSFFSFSWYLDAVAENWCVCVNEDYSAGIALPYTKRLGVEILYVPIFSRYTTPFGNVTKEMQIAISARFKVSEIATSIEFFAKNSDRIYQRIDDWGKRELSSQAKRSINKALKKGVTCEVTNDFTSVLTAIHEEISGKFKGVDSKSLVRLESVFLAAKKMECLRVFEVRDSEDIGGIVCLEDATQLLYLKGACSDQLKKDGGMYTALNQAALYAQERGLTFDFGGSNVDGVRQFNKNLGGTDQVYCFHESNKAPFWFNFARKLKERVS